jgi:hypothetical protein
MTEMSWWIVQDGDHDFIVANLSLWPITSHSCDGQEPTIDEKMDPRLFA